MTESRPKLELAGKRALVELALLGERLKFGLLGRPDASSAILVAGSGRSGTTWLMNVLSSGRGVQPVFEPLSPIWSERARRLTGHNRRDKRYLASHYLRPGEDHPEWHDFQADVLTGRVRSYWTDFERTSLLPDRFAINVIRANLMLGWICDRFHPAIVYVTRHPCAVVRARVRLGWKSDVADILSQEKLVEDYLVPHVDRIADEPDPLGTHAVWWGVENLVASRELGTRPHYRVSYEELCLRPIELARDLADWLDISLPRKLEPITRRPSRLSRRKNTGLSVEERLLLWKRQLSAEEQRRVLDWAHRLGVHDYDDGVLPTTTGRSGAFDPGNERVLHR